MKTAEDARAAENFEDFVPGGISNRIERAAKIPRVLRGFGLPEG
jgi:hypothetical protein